MLIPVMLVLVMAIWGGSFIAIKVALKYLSPIELVIARFLPSALLLGPLGMITARIKSNSTFWSSMSAKERWGAVLLSFLAVPAYHFCLNSGETMIPAGWASLVISLNPACITFFAAWILSERITLRRIIGIAIAFSGLLFIALTGKLNAIAGSQTSTLTILLGMTITLGAVVSWGGFTVGSKRIIGNRNSLLTLGWIMLLGVVWVIPWLRPAFFVKMAHAPSDVWWAVGFLSVGCTVVGFAAWFWVLERWAASRAGAFIYLVPLFALILGWLILKEPLGIKTGLGAGVVLGGVFLAGRREG